MCTLEYSFYERVDKQSRNNKNVFTTEAQLTIHSKYSNGSTKTGRKIHVSM